MTKFVEFEVLFSKQSRIRLCLGGSGSAITNSETKEIPGEILSWFGLFSSLVT